MGFRCAARALLSDCYVLADSLCFLNKLNAEYRDMLSRKAKKVVGEASI